MRRIARVLALMAVAAALPQASARGEPAAERMAASVSVPAPPPVVLPPRRVPRVIDVAPTGERVALDEPVVVRFDAEVPREWRGSLVQLLPDLPVDTHWLDDSAVELRPRRWHQGKPVRVTVSVPGTEPVEWSFRTRVPMPLAPLPGEGARLILSFDDGPNDRRQADRLLDRLKELGIRALFFPSGRWTKTRPDWVKRAYEEGHRVCNHTYSHVNLTAPWMTEARIIEEISRGAGDGECKLFRPPLMGIDKRVERVASELGYEIYLWDVDSRDWEGTPAEDLLATVLGRARPNAVVLFHIHADATYSVLPRLAELLRQAGYVLSWDPADAPASRVGDGGRAEWGALEDRPNEADAPMADADPSALGPPGPGPARLPARTP